MGDSTASRNWAFRVEDIPQGTTNEGLKTSFHRDDQPGVRIKSLVPAVDPGLNGGLTATVSFEPEVVSVQKPRLLDKNLIIDDKFFGFTPLFHPEGPIVADVIAITGLAGHAFASWAQPTGTMWLRDYLPNDVKNVRVLTYGYNSQLQGNEARSSLLSHSKNFIHRLREMRKVTECEERPVIFVGHSLGCLIIKNVLIEINGFTSNMPRLPVPTIVFFGSPNRGLETAELESFVKGTPSQDLVEELRPQSPTLESLNDKFRHVTSGISILSCYEQLGTPTAIKMPDGRWKREGPAKIMVPRYSALLGLPGEESLACEANHTQIAKLRRGENGYYYAVKGAVLKVAGSPTILFGVVAGDNNVKSSRRFLQNEIRGASRIQGNHTAETSQARRPSVDRIPEKQVYPTSETDEKTLSQVSFVPPGMEIPTQPRISVTDSSSEDEITIVPEVGRQNPRNAPSDTVTTASERFRTASGTSDVHLGQGTCEPESSGKQMLASDPPSQGQLCQAVLRGDVERVTALLLDGCSPHTSNEEAVELSQDPFLLAAKCREEQILKRFLELHADPLKHTLEKSETALHMLSTPYDGEQKSVTRSLVTLLLRYGAFVEARNKDDLTPLMLSAGNGEWRVVSNLLDRGADLKAIHLTSGWTPLHWAAFYCHRQTVDTLLSRGASSETPDVDGRTPLMVSVREGHVSTAACLLNRGADLHADQGESNLLFQSLCYINPEFLDQVISRGASLEVRNEDGSTPLLEFASQSNLKAVERLLDRSVNLQARTNDGRTALHLAAMNNHPAVVGSLISRGAPRGAKDQDGFTPLMRGCQKGLTKVLKILLDHDADLNARSDHGQTALHYAAREGHLLVVNHLLSRGAPLGTKDNTGVTPLMLSIENSRRRVRKRFLELGADVNARDDNGWTALHYAAKVGNNPVINDLASRGAPLDAKDRQGFTPLTVSIQNRHLKVLERLLGCGADLNVSDNLGWTPLHEAAYEGFLAAADLLISKGALLEARTSKTHHTHATPLHISTFRRGNSRECTKLLLKAGADMEALDYHGEPPLKLAACNGAVNALNELIASRANIEAISQTLEQWRALHVAKFHGNWQIIEVLLRNGADPFALDTDRYIPSQLGWFKGNQHQAAPSDADRDRCVKLLKDGEEAERQNGKRKQRDRRALREAKEQQDNLERCSIEALKDEEGISEHETETKLSKGAKNIDKQKGLGRDHGHDVGVLNRDPMLAAFSGIHPSFLFPAHLSHNLVINQLEHSFSESTLLFYLHVTSFINRRSGQDLEYEVTPEELAARLSCVENATMSHK